MNKVIKQCIKELKKSKKVGDKREISQDSFTWIIEQLQRQKSGLDYLEFKIKPAQNGYILLGSEGDMVYQTDPSDTEETEIERFANFLRAIESCLGPMTSRYSPARIYIQVKPGDKHESYKNDDTDNDGLLFSV